MQLLADFIQAPVEVFASPHATALGAAALARWGAGADTQLTPFSAPISATFEPSRSVEAAHDRLAAFELAISHARQSGDQRV